MLPSVKICLHSFLIFCTSPSKYVALNLLRSNTYCTGSAMKLFSSIIGCWQHNNHNHNRWHQKYMGDPKIFRLQWILSSCALIFCEVSLSSTEFQCKLWETRLSRCNECRLLKTTVWIIIGLYIICSGSYSHQLLGTRHMNNKYNKTIKDGDTYITLMVIIKLRPEDPGTLRQIVFNLNLCRNLKKLAEMCSCIRGKSITWLCSVRWIEVKSESNRYM